MSDSELTPQVPGETPNVVLDDLTPLLQLPVADMVAGLNVLTDAELVALEQLERDGEARENVLDAILAVQVERLEPSEPIGDDTPQVPDDEPAAPGVDDAPIELPSSSEPIGDDTSYRKMRAADIDQAKLVRPVLTLDGWLLPLPRTEGQG